GQQPRRFDQWIQLRKPEEINQPRRRFFGTAALTIAGAQLALNGFAEAHPSKVEQAGVRSIKPETNVVWLFEADRRWPSGVGAGEGTQEVRQEASQGGERPEGDADADCPQEAGPRRARQRGRRPNSSANQPELRSATSFGSGHRIVRC